MTVKDTDTTAAGTAKGESATVELTRAQQGIARRIAESRATIPDLTLTLEVDMTPALEWLAETAEVSYEDLVVKACALALREHPRVNSSYRDARVQLHSRVNVGVAVSTGDPGSGEEAVIVPTVFDADRKSLVEIGRETRTLAERARAGTISPPELGGATFTVYDLGAHGIREFSAVIVPPQTAIVAVGSLAPRPVADPRTRELEVRDTLTLTLSADHRVLYGAPAARFLARIAELLAEPRAPAG